MGPKKQKRKAQSPLPTPSPVSSLDTPVNSESPVIAPIRNLTMEAQIASISSKLDAICSKLQKMDVIETRLEQMENILCELKHENTLVRDELASARSESAKKDKVIADLSAQVNRLDQASRSNSIRVIGLPVTQHTSPADIKKTVFENIVNPCLESAKRAGEFPAMYVPFPDLLIDSAFSIPSKSTSNSPVIVKFSSASIRNIIFRHKKAALPQIKDPASNRMRGKYAVYEDLSSINNATLQRFAKDTRVRSTWSFNGQVRFKVHDSDTMYRVKSPTDTYEDLVSTADAAAASNPLMST